MGSFLVTVLREGKTVVGAALALIASAGTALTPADLETVRQLLEVAGVGGNAIIAIGLAHKLLKALAARSAAQ